MKTISLLLMITFFGCGKSMDSPKTMFSTGKEGTAAKGFSVLSYNVQGVPLISKNHWRLNLIGELLAQRRAKGTEPDVVLIQEAFAKRSRDLVAIADYPYVVYGPSRKDPSKIIRREIFDLMGLFHFEKDFWKKIKLLKSGLIIMSNHPITQAHSMAFGKKDCNGIDCPVNKGVMHARIKIKDTPFELDLFNTHMDAHTRPEDREARRKQIDFIDRLMKTVAEKGTPVIFVGDFNMTIQSENYDHFVELSGLTNMGEVCVNSSDTCTVDAETDPFDVYQNIDLHFANKNGSGVNITPVWAARNFTQTYDGVRLSDHDGFEMKYNLNWQVSPPGVGI